MRLRQHLLVLFVASVLLAGCTDGDVPATERFPLTRLATDRTYLRDDHGRYVFFHGVNLSGSSKSPAAVSSGGIPTYVGKPFPLETARTELAKIRKLGFNSLRLLVMWEGVEPVQRGEYDTAYLAYLREVVKLAGEQGLYVLLDMHQDIFSRHLAVQYNENPKYGLPGSIDNALLSLIKPYTDIVRGDGAPRWVVQACLSEKNMSSPNWGIPRLLGGIESEHLVALARLYNKLSGGSNSFSGPTPEWISYFLLNRPAPFAVNETSDMLPFTNWGLSHVLSLDVARSYACLLAGDVVFPNLRKDGLNIKEYLQRAYADAWVKVVEQVKDLPNVIGYDLMNEPSGNFLTLTAAAAMIRAGVVDGAKSALITLLGEETGSDMYEVLIGMRVLPPDSSTETLKLWGLDGMDVVAVSNLNNGFDDNHLRPFYERVGQAIQAADPKAVIFIENSGNASSMLGGTPAGGIAGTWEAPMNRPAGINHLVYAPHWYPDIYPFPGFNVLPREFGVEEVRHRDYQPKLESAKQLSTYSLGNPPVIFGEFGSYFNLNGIQSSIVNQYAVSANILDNYYEAFERMFMSNMLWCYSPENDYLRGDGWNKEDFSIIDPARLSRAELAWSRPYAAALAGKPISTHFYSDYHYFDPDKGVQIPRREFEVRYASKETAAPTEVVVPEQQFPEGFYVWISDGRCHFDASTQTLYHFPSLDAPGTVHWLRIRPPLPNQENVGWQYFFRGDSVVRSSGS